MNLCKPVVWLGTLWAALSSFHCAVKAKILTEQETVDYAIQQRYGIVRVGDGEFDIISGKSIYYQKHSIELERFLDQLLLYNHKNVLVCIPRNFFLCSCLRILCNPLYLRCWGRTRYLFKKRYDRNTLFGDAFLFSQGKEKIYEELWCQDEIKNVIFVHHNNSFAEKFEQMYKKNTIFIGIPDKDAFENKDIILRTIISLQPQIDTIVLISAGPCAKYLVCELEKQNIWAVDTGHCWDEPLKDLKER